MEEKELVQGFHQIFEEVIPLFERTKKGFYVEKASILKEEKAKFSGIIKSRVAQAASVVGKKDKNEVEKKFIVLLTSAQTMSLAIENLVQKLEMKVEGQVLFSEKALMEIKKLFGVIEAQLRDTADFLSTRNARLKEAVHRGMEEAIKLADEYEVIHQQRLIEGVCMPKASYLYLDIVDSFKRIARSLAEFAERV
jgi:Na+/phosphate symporter